MPRALCPRLPLRPAHDRARDFGGMSAYAAGGPVVFDRDAACRGKEAVSCLWPSDRLRRGGWLGGPFVVCLAPPHGVPWEWRPQARSQEERATNVRSPA